MYAELDLRLSGSRLPEIGSSKPSMNFGPIPQPNAPPPGMPRDGICFQTLAYQHGLIEDDDDHGMCLCQLATCLGCFHSAAVSRKGPISLLPHELLGSSVALEWTGQVESSAQAQARRAGLQSHCTPRQPIPAGQGFVRNPTLKTNGISSRPPSIFPHPQMTDVLAVEEQLRWRLKEMGAADPAVESRYGPSTNAATALEGVDLPEHSDEPSEDGSVKGSAGGGPPKSGKMIKVTRGKGKVRRVMNGVVPKKKDDGKKDDGKQKSICYLPKEWAEEDPTARNMAIVLTFRHFVKVRCDLSSPSEVCPDRLFCSYSIKWPLHLLHFLTDPTRKTSMISLASIPLHSIVVLPKPACRDETHRAIPMHGRNVWINGLKS